MLTCIFKLLWDVTKTGKERYIQSIYHVPVLQKISNTGLLGAALETLMKLTMTESQTPSPHWYIDKEILSVAVKSGSGCDRFDFICRPSGSSSHEGCEESFAKYSILYAGSTKPTGIFYLGRYFYSCFKKTQPVNHFCSKYANSAYRDTWLQSTVQKRDGCDSQTLLYLLRNNT